MTAVMIILKFMDRDSADGNGRSCNSENPKTTQAAVPTCVDTDPYGGYAYHDGFDAVLLRTTTAAATTAATTSATTATTTAATTAATGTTIQLLSLLLLLLLNLTPHARSPDS